MVRNPLTYSEPKSSNGCRASRAQAPGGAEIRELRPVLELAAGRSGNLNRAG
jgi:hypothetical protein